MVHQGIVLHLAAMLRLLEGRPWPMRKPHPCALAAKARVGEGSAAIEGCGVERVDVVRREGVQLGIGIEILVAQRPSLWLAVRGEAGLVERRADAGPAAEGPELGWHEMRCCVLRILMMKGIRVDGASVVALPRIGRRVAVVSLKAAAASSKIVVEVLSLRSGLGLSLT